MFYRWVKRLESMQMPATAFPAAGGEPVIETQESHELDGALIAASIVSLWLVVQSRWSETYVGLDWVVFVYAPILLVAVLGALIVRPDTSRLSIAAHVTAYAGLAALLGAMRATSAFEVVVWSGFFALIGLVTGVLCVVVWAVATHEVARPRTALHTRSGISPAVRLRDPLCRPYERSHGSPSLCRALTEWAGRHNDPLQRQEGLRWSCQ